MKKINVDKNIDNISNIVESLKLEPEILIDIMESLYQIKEKVEYANKKITAKENVIDNMTKNINNLKNDIDELNFRRNLLVDRLYGDDY